MDIFATCCAAAPVPPSAGIDGESFLPTLRGESHAPPERNLYFCRREGGLEYGGKTIEALIDGPWKLVQDSPSGPRELYNLAEDPLETTDLAKQRKPEFRKFVAALDKHLQAGGQVPWQGPAKGETDGSPR